MTTFPEYEQYDGLGLAELVRTGEVSPLELVEAAIERIEARNPQVNAVIHKMYEEATQTAMKTAVRTPDALFGRPLPAQRFAGRIWWHAAAQRQSPLPKLCPKKMARWCSGTRQGLIVLGKPIRQNWASPASPNRNCLAPPTIPGI
ncbi:MAG: hypothetical protein R3D55_16260 [Chloroflexota bacterium]